MAQPLFAKNGFCPICEQTCSFNAWSEHLRDTYLCSYCGSIPRERALMLSIDLFFPDWRALKIHESSPADRGVSAKLAAECRGYQTTQFHPDVPLGKQHPVNGWRCENLENQTFGASSFDLVVTQDVFEHIFHPDEAFKEIHRTLKSDGAMIATTPIVQGNLPTLQCVRILDNGEILHISGPDYHKNPVDEKGSLVTFYWGKDIRERIDGAASFRTQIIDIVDNYHGVEGPLNEVIVSRKIR